MYASAKFVVKLQTLTTIDPKYSKETSINVKPDAARSTYALKKSRSCQAISGRSSKKPVSTASMSAPISQPSFWGSCEGMNGHIFDIGPTQANRHIKKRRVWSATSVSPTQILPRIQLRLLLTNSPASSELACLLNK